ncbi:MAG: EamA family transporter [Parahaliea sp.]
MPHRQFRQSGLALVAAATVGMALKGIFARIVYQHGVSVDALLIWRFLLAVPLFWIGAVLINRGRSQTPLSRQQWGLCFLTGFLLFLSTWSDFNAIHLLGASISRVLLYLFPALILLFQSIEQRQLPARRQLAVVTIAWCGIALLLAPSLQAGTINTPGVLFGLGAATAYALFLWRSQGVMKQMGSVRFTQVSNSITLFFMLLFLLPTTAIDDLTLSPPAFGWMLTLVIISTVIPYFLMLEGIVRASAAEAGIMAMFGPALTVVIAVMLFPDEHLLPLQWLGFALVLLGIGALSMARPAGIRRTWNR